MGPYTHDIIQKIIQNCPLVNDIKEYKPSGNAKVNKVIKPPSPVKSYAPTRKARSHTRRAKKQPQCPAVCKGPNPPSGCMKCLRRLKYTLWGFDKRRKSRRKSRRRKSVRKSRRRKSRRKSRRRKSVRKSRRRKRRRKSRRKSRRRKSVRKSRRRRSRRKSRRKSRRRKSVRKSRRRRSRRNR